jgi:hypothetical protein
VNFSLCIDSKKYNILEDIIELGKEEVKMFKEFGRFKSFLILLLVFFLVLSFVGVVFGETGVENIRKDLKSRKSLISRMYTFSYYYL